MKYYYAPVPKNELVGFVHNGDKYYYQKNIRNDIIGLYNSSGSLVAKYEYNAWINHKVFSSTGVENTSAISIVYDSFLKKTANPIGLFFGYLMSGCQICCMLEVFSQRLTLAVINGFYINGLVINNI